MKSIIQGLLALALLAGPITASATTTTFIDDQAGFVAATGAASIGALTPGNNGHTVGVVTFYDGAPLGDLAIGPYSNELVGNSVAFSGPENFSMTITGGAYSFGFFVHEPNYETSSQYSDCNTPCFDTTFQFEIFAGATSLGTFTYNAPDDSSSLAGGPIGFFGVYSSVQFDRFVVRDVTGTADNEFFGNFLFGRSLITSTVPEPGSLTLFGLGILGLDLSRRRKAA